MVDFFNLGGSLAAGQEFFDKIWEKTLVYILVSTCGHRASGVSCDGGGVFMLCKV